MKSAAWLVLRVCLGLGVGALFLLPASPAAQSQSRVDDLLRTMGFSVGQVRELRTGAAVTRTLDTPVREELAHVGVVRIQATPQRFMERFRDIERFERGPGIPQIGRFGNPPSLEDLRSLTLPPADVAALRLCRPGTCGMKLPAAAMSRFREDVDWSSEGAIRQANDVFHQTILDLVRAYQVGGNSALGRYDDSDEPLLVADQVRALLVSDDPLPTPVPALLAYLDSYPRGRPDGAEDFFYWTVVEFGLKPTVRVNHVTVYPLDASASGGVAYAIATKQLYASHYFHTTLELRFLLADNTGDRLGSWLVSITRSRNDGMTGFRGLFVRPIVARRSRDGVNGYLEHVKRQFERPASAAF